MYNKLKKLLENSYSPYSNFKVSAILETKDGKEFNGVNVENASYGAAICAERSAIVSSISAGYNKGSFKKLSIMVSGSHISFPCYVCRQVFIEFFDLDMEIVCYNINGDFKSLKVSDLCNYAFSSEDLK